MAMPETETQSKERSIFRLFRDEDGKIGSRATENVVAIGFKYADDEESWIDLAKVFGGNLPPPSVGRAAAALGVSTSAGNAGGSVAKAAGHNPEVIREAVEKRLETFVPEDGSPGEWSAERDSGGPRTSVLLEALKAYRQQHNADTSDAKMAELREKLKDEEWRKKYLSHQDFQAVLLKVKRVKAEQREAEAAKKATGEKSTELLQ